MNLENSESKESGPKRPELKGTDFSGVPETKRAPELKLEQKMAAAHLKTKKMGEGKERCRG